MSLYWPMAAHQSLILLCVCHTDFTSVNYITSYVTILAHGCPSTLILLCVCQLALSQAGSCPFWCQQCLYIDCIAQTAAEITVRESIKSECLCPAWTTHWCVHCPTTLHAVPACSTLPHRVLASPKFLPTDSDLCSSRIRRTDRNRRKNVIMYIIYI